MGTWEQYWLESRNNWLRLARRFANNADRRECLKRAINSQKRYIAARREKR